MKNKLRILKTEKGATFVEIMLAVAILAIIAVPLLSTVIASVRNNSIAKQKTEAIALAEMAMGNIKAQTSLSRTTPPAIYIEGDDLNTYYAIEDVVEGKVLQNTQTQFTYDTSTVEEANFELIVDQKELKLGGNGTVDITVNVKDVNTNKFNTYTIENIDINNENLELNVDNDSFLLNSAHKSVYDTFTPINNQIIIKVKFAKEDAPVQEGTYKPLKINTYDKSDKQNNLIIYVVDSSDHKPGVNFINKGKNKDFNLAYITSDVFDYNSAVNKLFKVTIIIKNKSQDEEIYRVSSYVKK